MLHLPYYQYLSHEFIQRMLPINSQSKITQKLDFKNINIPFKCQSSLTLHCDQQVVHKVHCKQLQTIYVFPNSCISTSALTSNLYLTAVISFNNSIVSVCFTGNCYWTLYVSECPVKLSELLLFHLRWTVRYDNRTKIYQDHRNAR